MPLMHDVRGVTLGEAGDLALVSYEGNAPPQTWYLNRIPDTRTQEDGPKYQIKLSKTYYPMSQVEFAGTSHFGAYKDTLVLAASKAGEIYIWERSSANLIHTLTVPSKQELTGLAWNPKSTGNKFTIASAMRNGMVNIWTTNASKSQSEKVLNHRQSDADDSGQLALQVSSSGLPRLEVENQPLG
ncbi:unnamed protein product [Rhizoctonia solani]|uniref:Uncharacterized protein n=1 Tax=Rhizoctonia solani TaxID=456999 RepID=A0A8H3AMH9_9AGAM|nr:unnamed protein product [Rhizoctonia solani]